MPWTSGNGKARGLPERGVFLAHVLSGAVLGVVLLHPAAMAIYWLEFRPDSVGLLEFVTRGMVASLWPSVAVMNALFLVLGGTVGAAFGSYHWVLAAKRRELRSFTHELATDVVSLIATGENEHVEFKSSARWDVRRQRVNKDLEDVLVKTIAGMLNHRGGSLLIGVSDGGEIVGLDADYRTLKHKNRDGFAQLLMSLVRDRLGAHVCTFVHPVFVEIDGADVCRVVTDPCDRPVYCHDRGGARYFLRTGNSTRELDVREAIEHIQLRRGSRRTSRQRSSFGSSARSVWRAR